MLHVNAVNSTKLKAETSARSLSLTVDAIKEYCKAAPKEVGREDEGKEQSCH